MDFVVFGGFNVKNHISYSEDNIKHTLKSMDFCIVYPIRPFDLIQDHLT